MKRFLVVAAVLLCAARAGADVTVPGVGNAPITAGSDLQAARARAMDEACRAAVTAELAVLIDEQTRTLGADAIKRRILRKAQSYVTQFKIKSESNDATGYHLEIDAVVADGQLVADVKALNIGVAPVAPTVAPTAPVAASARRPNLVLLAVVADGAEHRATFGRAGDEGGPAAAALGRELAARGFKVVTAGGVDVPVALAGDSDTALPLDVAQATLIARKVGAGGDVVAGIAVGENERIRGTRELGAEVTMNVRLDDADARATATLVEEKASGAGYGHDRPAAIAAAARLAAGRAGRKLGPRLESHWPEDAAGPSEGIAIRVRGAARWSDVEPLVHAFAGTPGVKRVVVVGFALGEITLLVRGPVTAGALAGVAQSTPLAAARATAKAADSRQVVVELTSEAMPSALPPGT